MSDSLTHFISSQEFRLIPLSGKHGEGKFAIVDAGDYDRETAELLRAEEIE